MPDRARHWDDGHRYEGSEGISWYQPEPVTSLELIRLLDVPPSTAVIDVGGGTSRRRPARGPRPAPFEGGRPEPRGGAPRAEQVAR